MKDKLTKEEFDKKASELFSALGIDIHAHDPLELKIKYNKPDTKRLEKIEIGDWIDVYADETVTIKQGESALISLGFALQLPYGYEAHLAPRSSTFKKWGIIMTNSFGIIDESYCGDNDIWKFTAYCLQGKADYLGEPCTIINRGDKIGQFRIIEKMPTVKFVEVEHLGNSDRGGFGSTGSV